MRSFIWWLEISCTLGNRLLPRRTSGREVEQGGDSGSECLAVRLRWQVRQLLILRHFPHEATTSIRVGLTVVRTVRAAVAPVHQFIRRKLPTLQFDQRHEPVVQLPAPDARPKRAYLLPAGSPDLLHGPESLPDRPPVGGRLKDLTFRHRTARAEVGGPVAVVEADDHHADLTSGHHRGRRGGLRLAGYFGAAASIGERLPALRRRCTPDQADRVFAVLARSTAFAYRCRRQLEELRVPSQAADERRSIGAQRLHLTRRETRPIGDHGQAGPTAGCAQLRHVGSHQIERQLVLGADSPAVTSLEAREVDLPNLEQRKRDHATVRMLGQQRQANPVVLEDPRSFGLARRRMVMHVGPFDMPADASCRTFVDRQLPPFRRARIEPLDDLSQQRHQQNFAHAADHPQKIIESVPVIGDSGRLKPATGRAPRAGQHHSSQGYRQPKGGSCVEQPRPSASPATSSTSGTLARRVTCDWELSRSSQRRLSCHDGTDLRACRGCGGFGEVLEPAILGSLESGCVK